MRVCRLAALCTLLTPGGGQVGYRPLWTYLLVDKTLDSQPLQQGGDSQRVQQGCDSQRVQQGCDSQRVQQGVILNVYSSGVDSQHVQQGVILNVYIRD